MAYEVKKPNGEIVTLHQNNKNPNLRYFTVRSKQSKKKGTPIDCPAGYTHKFMKRTGHPILVRINKKKKKKK
jgi:hypothetical protein